MLSGGRKKCDLLVQNLACMPDGFEVVDGHERALSTNLLAFYALSTALHPLIAEGGRVINVVSAGMHLHRLHVPSLRALDRPDGVDGKGYDPIYAYCATHRARVLLTRRWAAEPREVETAEPLGEADGVSMLPATGTRAVAGSRSSGPAFYEL